jgi:hypothetical protein
MAPWMARGKGARPLPPYPARLLRRRLARYSVRRGARYSMRRDASRRSKMRRGAPRRVAAPRVASRPSESRRGAPRCVAALRDASCLYLGVCRDGWRDGMGTCVRETGLRARVCTVPDQTCHIMYHHLNARSEAASDHGPERRLAFSASPYAPPFAESWKMPNNSDRWHHLGCSGWFRIFRNAQRRSVDTSKAMNNSDLCNPVTCVADVRCRLKYRDVRVGNALSGSSP